MKRTSRDDIDGDISHKRPKAEDDSDPFRVSPRRKASDLGVKGVDESEFIEGKVFMQWPAVGGRVRVGLEFLEDGDGKRMEVAFTGACLAVFASAGLKFEIKDTVQLSLKGATLLQEPLAKGKTLPVKLLYASGFRVKFLTKRTTPPSVGMLVDSWEREFSNRVPLLRDISLSYSTSPQRQSAEGHDGRKRTAPARLVRHAVRRA